MRRLIWALLAAAVAALAPAARAAGVCTYERVATIPFETDDTAHVFVPATLEGQATRLMVDTGGWWSVIAEEFADRLNLARKKSYDVWIVDSSGAKLDQYVSVGEVRLHNVLLSKRRVDFIVAKRITNMPVEKMGGTLGLNIFTGVDLEIDNAAKTISLYKPNRCEVPYWSDESVTLKYRNDSWSSINVPVVGAELDGESVRTLIDTGSTVSSMSLSLAARRFGITPQTPGVESSGEMHLPSGKTVAIYSYTFKKLVISGIAFENVPVHLGDFEDKDLVLGMNELKLLRLYFSFKNRTIHVTAADAGR